MTYLTRMPLNPARRDTRALLGSPQSMHAAVLAGFPPGAADEPAPLGRVLWRVDQDSRFDVRLHVCSPEKPDLTHLVEQAGWPTTSAWETRAYAPLLDRLAPGQAWAFRLTANPVRRLRVTEGGKRGPVKAHVTADQQLTWLVERSAAAGFAIPPGASGEPAVSVRDRKAVRFAHDDGQITLVTATFEGLLTVTDLNALRVTLTGGLGRAKSYGCGLLTLAPVPQ